MCVCEYACAPSVKATLSGKAKKSFASKGSEKALSAGQVAGTQEHVDYLNELSVLTADRLRGARAVLIFVLISSLSKKKKKKPWARTK